MKPLFAFLLAFLEVSLGHNWMVSPSRVPFAATNFPCMAPRNNFPHIQVAQGQRFQMEWATGHDRYVYFVLIDKNQSEHLKDHSERMVDRYIDAAPQQLMSPTWAKYHRTSRSWTSQHTLGGPLSNYYAAEIMPGDSRYITRPAEFGPTLKQYSYSSSPADRYVSYRSATYPWVISAWKYEIQSADPNEWDVSLFEIPSSFTTGGGDFILHYLWSGYYDCIDVNVLPRATPPVPYVYGKPINGSEALRVNRIDHCVFDSPFQYTSFPRYIVNGARGAAESCIQKCKWWYENGCGGVSVFPLSAITKNWGPHWNPNNNVLKNFYEQAWNISGHFWDGLFNVDDGIPYDNVDGNWRGLWRIYAPASFGEQFVGVHQSTINTLRSWIESQNDPWVCIMTNPRFPSTTSDKMTLADDPDDPIWSSTCYEVVEQLEFIGFNVTTNTFEANIPTNYVVGNCISCEDAVAWGDEKQVPRWEIASKCSLCERDNPTPDPSGRIPFLGRVQVNAALNFVDGNTCGATPPSGANWNEYCTLKFKSYHPLMGIDYPSTMTSQGFVWPPETLHETPEVCGEWARKQPECSKWVVHAQADWIGCQCVRNTACCLNTMRSTYASWATGENVASLYELVPTPADPTCANGIRNTNNTVCCKGTRASTSCNSYGCVDRTDQPWVGNPGTMCIAYNVPPERSCAEFGAPCRLA